jgi:hypothetical protein
MRAQLMIVHARRSLHLECRTKLRDSLKLAGGAYHLFAKW